MGGDGRIVENQTTLFDIPEMPLEERLPPEPAVKAIEFPVWTDNKARFIMCYLRYFVLLTKHGTYIDGFAGPQSECATESWAAKLVLASEPQWIKHFHLCDEKRAQITRLEELKKAQPIYDSKGRKLYRKIHIYQGDFNTRVDEILANGNISQKQSPRNRPPSAFSTSARLNANGRRLKNSPATRRLATTRLSCSTSWRTVGLSVRWRGRKIWTCWRNGGVGTTGRSFAP